MDWYEIIVLLSAGFSVGFINTVAGGATVISLAAMMMLGLPMSVANATHRIAAFFQTAASTGTFIRSNVISINTGLRLGVPVTLGSIIGAWLAVAIDERSFEFLAGGAMILILLAMLLKPGIWTQGKLDTPELKPKPWQYLLFFFIGLYGGLIYIGIGYVLLAGLVLGTGFDLLRANALKVFIVMLYVPFTLIPFILNDLIVWKYAIILSVGQATGALLAARISVRAGSGFIRWVMILFLVFTITEIFHITDIRSLFARN